MSSEPSTAVTKSLSTPVAGRMSQGWYCGHKTVLRRGLDVHRLEESRRERSVSKLSCYVNEWSYRIAASARDSQSKLEVSPDLFGRDYSRRYQFDFVKAVLAFYVFHFSD